MVYYSTPAEIDNAFGPLIGYYDYTYHTQHPDSDKALALAELKPGESVLDVGAGGGRFVANAKKRVGSGVCVAVDAVQGFISTDIPWMLQQQGLAAYPDGNPDTQVHCLRANITSNSFVATVRAIPGAPQRFDCIVALHLFTTLSPQQRRPALVALRQLLSPSGRLILNMSARFADASPSPADSALPVQFRTMAHTEAPGATIYTSLRRDGPQVPVPHAGAGNLPRKVVTTTIQIAPDQFWTVAAAQAREAAQDAGFMVSSIRPIGKGSDWNLPEGRRSPPQAALDAMSFEQLLQLSQQPPTLGAYNCIGRSGATMMRHITPGWQQMAPHVRDCVHAEGMQDFVAKEYTSIANDNHALPAGGAVVVKKVEATQVGVLVRLTKM
ncbi:hypothetical protein BM1_10407 [Bipolaris maydis]|nr:hypothetical protein BM1_10407 [Bipolaris maydis]